MHGRLSILPSSYPHGGTRAIPAGLVRRAAPRSSKPRPGSSAAPYVRTSSGRVSSVPAAPLALGRRVRAACSHSDARYRAPRLSSTRRESAARACTHLYEGLGRPETARQRSRAVPCPPGLCVERGLCSRRISCVGVGASRPPISRNYAPPGVSADERPRAHRIK